MSADQDFAQKAAMGGKHEVEGAKFAAGKATNASVKSFANKLVKDHTAANNELMSLMKKKNITAGADDKPAAEAWRNETGAAFDRAYHRSRDRRARERHRRLRSEIQGRQRRRLEGVGRQRSCRRCANT